MGSTSVWVTHWFCPSVSVNKYWHIEPSRDSDVGIVTWDASVPSDSFTTVSVPDKSQTLNCSNLVGFWSKVILIINRPIKLIGIKDCKFVL